MHVIWLTHKTNIKLSLTAHGGLSVVFSGTHVMDKGVSHCCCDPHMQKYTHLWGQENIKI